LADEYDAPLKRRNATETAHALCSAVKDCQLEQRFADIRLGLAVGRVGLRRIDYRAAPVINQPAESMVRVWVADDFEDEANVGHAETMCGEPCAWLAACLPHVAFFDCKRGDRLILGAGRQAGNPHADREALAWAHS
jgi:hypothetical protein